MLVKYGNETQMLLTFLLSIYMDDKTLINDLDSKA